MQRTTITTVEADVLARFFTVLHKIALRDIANPDPIIRQSGLDVARLIGTLSERTLPGASSAANNPFYRFAADYPDGRELLERYCAPSLVQ